MPNESHSWHHSAEAELDVQLGMAETGPAATWNKCRIMQIIMQICISDVHDIPKVNTAREAI
jgi:hypothetical protein